MPQRIIKWVVDAFLTLVMGVTIVTLCAGAWYLSYSWQMSGYEQYVTCNPGSAITRVQWFLGIRPFPNDCWHSLGS